MPTCRFAVLALLLVMPWSLAASSQPIPSASVNNNRTPGGELRKGVLTLHLEMRQAVWYPDEDGKTHLIVSAFAEEGHAPQIPGPLVRVTAGTEVAASIRNLLDRTMFVHGLAPRLDANAAPPAMGDP